MGLFSLPTATPDELEKMAKTFRQEGHKDAALLATTLATALNQISELKAEMEMLRGIAAMRR